MTSHPKRFKENKPGGTCNTECTLNQFKQLALHHSCAIKLARKRHAHAVMYANELVITRHVIENNRNFQLSSPRSGRGYC
eukprot:1149534-Pelagomonas_calceolata.AAC.1